MNLVGVLRKLQCNWYPFLFVAILVKVVVFLVRVRTSLQTAQWDSRLPDNTAGGASSAVDSVVLPWFEG